MKRFILILAALLTAIWAEAGTIVKNYDNLSRFSGISISNTFDATLVKGDYYGATVTIATDMAEYLDVSVIGTVLYVRLKENAGKLKELTRKTAKVTITTPSLSQIHLSGAVTLHSNDLWESPMQRFTLSVTGKSKAEKLRLGGSELKADISGASNCSLTGDFAILDINVEGASSLSLSGQFDDIDTHAHGTSKVTLIGNADDISGECTGSSFIDAEQLKVDDARIVCKGASKATVYVNEKLDIELGGASTCRYRTNNDALEIIPSISRASSFKRIN